MRGPRLIKTFLPDGSLEGIRIIELSESSIKAFVVPRLKLADIRDRKELAQPSLYVLLSGDGNTGYVGECENFYHRIKNHDQTKDFWDIAIAFVSNTNDWEKGDVKFLESQIVKLSRETGSINIINKTKPAPNLVHEFKLYSLGRMARDIREVAAMLGYDLLNVKPKVKTWYCHSKLTVAKAQFRGGNFVLLEGSVIDKAHTQAFQKYYPSAVAERQEFFAKFGEDLGQTVKITRNLPFKSPNHAGGFVAGRNVNAWTTWKDSAGKTMDEVMRKGEI